MKNEALAAFRARIFTASNAIPLENTIVRIRGGGENYRDIQYSLLTDVDGLTPIVYLPAPDKALSLSPSPSEYPYSVYDVEIIKEGYYPKKILDVPLFDSVMAVLPIEMIPLAYLEDGTLIQLKNINSVVTENPRL